MEPIEPDWLPIWFSIKNGEKVAKEFAELKTQDLADETIDTANLPHRIIARHGVGRRDTSYPLKKFKAGNRAVSQHPDVLRDTLLRIFEKISDYAFEIISTSVIAAEYGGVPQLTPKTRDGGLDGIVRFKDSSKSDILIQSKQWATPIGPDDLDKFLLDAEVYSQDQFGHGGEATDFQLIFVSMMGFTTKAKKYEQSTDLILIDGEDLAQMAIKNKVGIEELSISVLDEIYWRDLGEQ